VFEGAAGCQVAHSTSSQMKMRRGEAMPGSTFCQTGHPIHLANSPCWKYSICTSSAAGLRTASFDRSGSGTSGVVCDGSSGWDGFWRWDGGAVFPGGGGALWWRWVGDRVLYRAGDVQCGWRSVGGLLERAGHFVPTRSLQWTWRRSDDGFRRDRKTESWFCFGGSGWWSGGWWTRSHLARSEIPNP
jgi:hypothetical protein